MDISVRTTDPYVAEDRSWLASAHGTEACRTITLDVTLFTKATHYPAGVLKSGTVLAEVTDPGPNQGLFGPYEDGATDGREVASGFLWNSMRISDTTADHLGAPMQEHGAIDYNNLPSTSGIDTNAKADLAGRFTFR